MANSILLSAGEDGGGERLEEERGGHVRHGGAQEDVRCRSQPVRRRHASVSLQTRCVAI